MYRINISINKTLELDSLYSVDFCDSTQYIFSTFVKVWEWDNKILEGNCSKSIFKDWVNVNGLYFFWTCPSWIFELEGATIFSLNLKCFSFNFFSRLLYIQGSKWAWEIGPHSLLIFRANQPLKVNVVLMTLIGKSYWNNSIEEFVGIESWLLLITFYISS